MPKRASFHQPWDTPSSAKRAPEPAIIGLLAIAFACVCAVAFLLLSGHGENIILEMHTEGVELDSEVPEVQGAEICVHVAGHVDSPGLVRLKAGARVNDAIEAAGGFSEDADTQALNLARNLADGEQVVVPGISDRTSQQAEGASAAASADAGAFILGKLDINKATEKDFETLSGIGPVIAARIVDDRNANGPFATIEDIMRVAGIGEKLFARIESGICIG